MAIGRRIGRGLLALLVVLGLALWVAALLLFSEVTEPSNDFASNALPIVLINTVGVAVLLALIGNRLLRLIREYRRFVPGSRLKARVVSLVVLLAAVPLIVIYVFSLLFISKGMDDWFPVDVSQVATAAMELSNSVIEFREKDDLAEIRELAGRLELDPGQAERRLTSLWRETTAAEVALYSADGRRILALAEPGSGQAPLRLTADTLDRLETEAAIDNGGMANLEPQLDNTYEVHGASKFAGEAGPVILWARFPVPLDVAGQINAVQARLDAVSGLEDVKTVLQLAFTLSLSLVLLVAVLAAVYAAFFFTERLISPIQQLMQGTRAVARGDFDTRVALSQSDEIGFLANSFNDMTQRLALARQEARDSEQRLEEERSKLEVILRGLSTGVVSLERDLTIRTANKAAGEILGVDLEKQVGESLLVLAENGPMLRQFLAVSTRHLNQGISEWREQITLRGDLGNRELICACTELPAEGRQARGYVIVFDDITVLMQAQREAAWGEVARRISTSARSI